MGEYRLLLEHAHEPDYATLNGYMARGGYEALKKALCMDRQAVIDEVKASGLRGRGGAGFPAWIKWNGIPKDRQKPHYVLCNADEGEPGTFKDKQLMEQCPHMVLEGMAIAAYATMSDVAYIYIRGEYVDAAKSMRRAIDEALEAGLIGKNACGTEVRIEIHIHMGAGSYECGEESAMMSSLMGERGMPRLKFPHAPLPVVAGLWDCPTLINNVETLASVPHIIARGGDWYGSLGANTQRSRGTKIFSVSGNVNKPGNYEVELGTPLMELIDLAGGVEGKLKAVIPGGSSVPILPADKCDGAILGYEELWERGTQLGSGGFMVLNEDVCIVTYMWRTALFYARESCGKCTPCREGTSWMVKVLERILRGGGRMEDIETLSDICKQIDGRSFCALGDAAAWPIAASIKHYRNEYEHWITQKCSPVAPERLAVMVPSL
ncbi:MAG: NADH-quinone oxidoreductase subunit F [Fimbriimonadales bacterium]